MDHDNNFPVLFDNTQKYDIPEDPADLTQCDSCQ